MIIHQQVLSSNGKPELPYYHSARIEPPTEWDVDEAVHEDRFPNSESGSPTKVHTEGSEQKTYGPAQ